jgi:hypothetical protein
VYGPYIEELGRSLNRLGHEVVQKDRTERTSLFMLKAIVRSFLNHLRELRDTFPIRNLPR